MFCLFVLEVHLMRILFGDKPTGRSSPVNVATSWRNYGEGAVPAVQYEVAGVSPSGRNDLLLRVRYARFEEVRFVSVSEPWNFPTAQDTERRSIQTTLYHVDGSVRCEVECGAASDIR